MKEEQIKEWKEKAEAFDCIDEAIGRLFGVAPAFWYLPYKVIDLLAELAERRQVEENQRLKKKIAYVSNYQRLEAERLPEDEIEIRQYQAAMNAFSANKWFEGLKTVHGWSSRKVCDCGAYIPKNEVDRHYPHRKLESESEDEKQNEWFEELPTEYMQMPHPYPPCAKICDCGKRLWICCSDKIKLEHYPHRKLKSWGGNPLEHKYRSFDSYFNEAMQDKEFAETYKEVAKETEKELNIEKWFAGLEMSSKTTDSIVYCDGCGLNCFLSNPYLSFWKQRHFYCQFALTEPDLLEIVL